MSFWDTSALAKLYVPEPDSLAFDAIAISGGDLVITTVTVYEARTVFRRRELDGVIPAGGAATCYQKLIGDIRSGRIRMVNDSPALEVEFGRVLEQCFSAAPATFVRTCDALHLSAAKVAGQKEFVSADIRQRQAAALLGFVLTPATYPFLP